MSEDKVVLPTLPPEAVKELNNEEKKKYHFLLSKIKYQGEDVPLTQEISDFCGRLEEIRKKTEEQLDIIPAYCESCLIIIKEGWDSEAYEYHLTSFQHQKLLEYEEGTGCDICRTTHNPSRAHSFLSEHITALRYSPGTGCDICKRNVGDITVHNRKYAKKHDKRKNYIQGSGCDICHVEFPNHEESVTHTTKLIAKNQIYDQFIIPLRKKKSARF